MDRFTGHYDAWTENRIAWITGAFGERCFEGKTVLDIGGGRGHVARKVLELGARSVEVVEGRMANIAEGEELDGLVFQYANLERGLTSLADSYDIVLNFGTIYHLANWEQVLIESVLRARELVFVETEVIDSDVEPNRYVVENGDGYDQSMSGVGSRPSEFEIDRLLARLPNARPRKILDSALNADFHRYDWRNRFDGRVEDGLRRFWCVYRSRDVDTATERAGAESLLREVHHLKTMETLVMTRRAQHALEQKLDAVIEALGLAAKT